MSKNSKALIANLPRGVSIYPDGDNYRVRLGRKFTGGAVQKRRFDTLKEAREWIFGDAKTEQATPPPLIDQKAEGGTNAFELTPKQITEAAAAVRKLGKLGSLTEAVTYFLKHAKPAGGEKTAAEAAENYLKAKRASGRSEKHLKGLRSIFKTFSDDFGTQPIHLITRTAFEEWLEELELSPTTKGNYIRDLKSLFADAVRREWSQRNPIEYLEKPKANHAEIHILDIPQTKKLLTAAEDSNPAVVPALALKLFAGLRTSELLQLTWENIRSEEIIVSATVAKTRQRRLVTIRPNLKKWLATHRKTTGPILEGTQNQYHAAIEQLAQIAKTPIKPNVFRHTFASYLYALLKNENIVAAEMGNSPKVVFSNYRALVPKAGAQEFWKILPAKKSNIVAFADVRAN